MEEMAAELDLRRGPRSQETVRGALDSPFCLVLTVQPSGNSVTYSCPTLLPFRLTTTPLSCPVSGIPPVLPVPTPPVLLSSVLAETLVLTLSQAKRL